MSKFTHYTPPLSRFIVCALYHQAKEQGIPMTRLANNLVQAGLKDSSGWQKAQQQMQLAEGEGQYHTNATHPSR